jgi:hypothetical protein
MNKPYNIQNTNICNGIFHISFFKALLINEGETTRGERDSGRNDPGRTGFGAKRPGTILTQASEQLFVGIRVNRGPAWQWQYH